MDTILIVDDDPAIRELFSIYLRMGGYKALTVPGGTACLDLLKHEVPGLIVLDLMMEPMDGWETLLAITGSASTRHIPVIVITGKQPVPADILKYGGLIWDYHIKPVNIEKIVGSLHGVIEKDRDLAREIHAAGKRGHDRELTGEYGRLVRLVTSVQNLEKRRRKHAWTDTVPIAEQEVRLRSLHKILDMPDRLLEPDESG